MTKTIAFIIPRGEVIRNFAYSGILMELNKQYELHLIAVYPNKELQAYLQEQCHALHELNAFELSYVHRYFLGLLDLGHNRYLWSEAARVRWNMRDVEARTLSARLKRSFNKILTRFLANNACLSWMERILIRISGNEKGVQHYERLLNEIKPDLLFNGSHSHSTTAYPVVQAARLNGIKTAAFLFSWDNLTSQGRVIPPYDYVLAWNEQIREDFLRIYPKFPANHILVSGTPQFAFHFMKGNRLPRKDFLAQLGLKPNDRFVLYSSGMSHHMPYEPEVAELVADILKEIDPKLKLVVRTYAKDKAEVFESLKNKRPDILIPKVKWEKNFQTPLLADQTFFTNLLLHCELGVNVASTVSLELCLLDKPAINIGFNPPGRDIYPYDYTRFYAFDHYKPIVESGAVVVAENPEDLKSLIRSHLEVPGLLSNERTYLIKKFFGTEADHENAQQVIDHITAKLQLLVH